MALPFAIVAGRQIGEELPVLAQQHDGLADPGLAEMRYDHAQLGESTGNLVEQNGVAVLERRVLCIGPGLVPEDRDLEGVRHLIEPPRLLAPWMETGIDGREFEAT